MRNLLINKLRVFIFAAPLFVLLFGCEKDGKYRVYEYPAPEVTQITPASGYVASQVAISGTNFGDRIDPVKIFFGGVEADRIVSCKNNLIIVEVPVGAQSGDISLQVWTHTLQSIGDFSVIPTPVINSTVSDNAAGEIFAVAGDKVIITGSAFGSAVEDVKVTINNKQAQVLSVMENEITAEVPTNYGSGLVVVSVKGYEVEGTALIDPSTTGDVTRLFLKNYAQPFQRGDTGDAEWGSALYWLQNSNFVGSSLQFTDDVPDGLIAMQAGGGQSNKQDGALYQLTSLPAGTYTFTIYVASDVKISGRYGVRFAVTKGEGTFSTMKEVAEGSGKVWVFNDLTNVLSTVNIATNSGNTPVTHTCSATLTETTRVTIGFATMLATNNYVKVSAVRIDRN